ncbi:MAG: class GN sortase [Granulosicoccaceae bacterium]|jgi:sortase A
MLSRRLVLAVSATLLVAGMALVLQAGWIHAKAVLAQHLLQHSWQQVLLHNRNVPAWPWADIQPVAQLHVPVQAASQLVLDSDSGAALAFAPGVHNGSAMPGHAGISLVAAHRDTHFAYLKELAAGDEVFVTRRDKRSVRYRVTDRRVVDTRQGGLAVRAGQASLLLVTCYPFDAVAAATPYRYVVTTEAVTTTGLSLQ